MNNTTDYDILICGGGLAGLSLGYYLQRDAPMLRIAVLEARTTYQQDRHWGFWFDPRMKHPFQPLILAQYNQWNLYSSSEKPIKCRGQRYGYGVIRSKDFYSWMHEQLAERLIMNCPCEPLSASLVKTAQGNLTARMVIDARTEPVDALLYQQFHGWVVRTDSPCFNPAICTLMDFRLSSPKNSCGFAYILPFSENCALVEPTLLTSTPIDESWFRQQLEAQMMGNAYEITDSEAGCLPLGILPPSTTPSGVYPIGTRAGWMRPSTGYAFAHTQKKARQLASHVARHQALPPASPRAYSSMARRLDTVFVRVMRTHPHHLDAIFSHWFSQMNPDAMIAFLHDNASFNTALRLLAKTRYKAHFIEALWRR